MLPKTKQVGGIELADGLFKDIKFYLIGTIDDKVVKLLTSGGGKQDCYLSEMITYVIADDTSEPDYLEAKELFELPVITSRWVVLSARCGVLLPINAFSPESGQIFSSVVACPSQLSRTDSQSLWSVITVHGGRCQLKLNSSVTHLVTTKPSGLKYDCALRHSDRVAVVCPDWLTKCVSEKRRVDETTFHPRLLVFEEEKPPTPPPLPPTELPPPTEPVSQKLVPFIGQPSYPPVGHRPSPPPAPPHRRVSAATSPEGSRAREALARMVAQRLSLDAPPRALPPGGATGTPDAAAARSMLKNITNSGAAGAAGAASGSPSTSSPRPAKAPRAPRSPARRQKINQMVGGFGRSPKQLSFAAGASPAQHHQRPLAAGRQVGMPDMPVYYGHDPTETIPASFCLLGCVFYVTDYQKYLDVMLIDTWREVILAHGGQVDESYSNRVTHVLCEHQRSDVFQLALRDGKRLVTAHWLDNCLLQQKMDPPCLALHFPSPYAKEKPCSNQIFCVSNFEGEERTRLKQMFLAIGAKYTGYMTRANSALIVRRPTGTKYEKALQWRLPVVNVAWLNEIVLGDLRALKLPVHSRFQQFSAVDPFCLELWRVVHLLEGWKIPVRVSKDTWRKFQPSQLLKCPSAGAELNGGVIGGQKRKADDLLAQLDKRSRVDGPAVQPLPGRPVVLITSLSLSTSRKLTQEIHQLGGAVVAVAAPGCTHLVASSVVRTIKFLSCFCHVRHIVTPAWVEESTRRGCFVDETPFVLHDDKAETTFDFRLADSLAKAKQQPIFQGLSFYVTPGVVPSRKSLDDIISCYGGEVMKKRPSLRTIRSQRNTKGEPTFFVITCDNDLHLSADLSDQRIHVYNAEFVLTGVMQQTIDFIAFRLIN